MKKKEKEISEMGREIIAVIATQQYIGYCKNLPKKVLFEHEGQLITTRNIEKISLSFENAKGIRIKKWRMFIKKIGKLALSDKTFIEALNIQFDTCEKCGYYPIKREKASRYHPEWSVVQQDSAKSFNKNIQEQLKEPNEVFIEICPQCNNEEVMSTGIDKNPEEGLR